MLFELLTGRGKNFVKWDYCIHYEVWDEISCSFPNFNSWSLEKDMWFHPTLYWACDYLYMLRYKLIHISKRGHIGYCLEPDYWGVCVCHRVTYGVNSFDAAGGISWFCRSIPCLLMHWLLKSPEYQQAWFWLCVRQTICNVVPELFSSTWVKLNARYNSKCEYIFHNLENNSAC